MFATLSRTAFTPDGTKSAFEMAASRPSPTRKTTQAMSAIFIGPIMAPCGDCCVQKKAPPVMAAGLRGRGSRTRPLPSLVA